MKTELPCGIVQDLLPSYADGVAGEESAEAVEEHVAACPACAAMLAEMKAPLPERETAVREVNYLKKVKRSRRKAVALALALLFFGLEWLEKQSRKPETRGDLSARYAEQTVTLNGKACRRRQSLYYNRHQRCCICTQLRDFH